MPLESTALFPQAIQAIKNNSIPELKWVISKLDADFGAFRASRFILLEAVNRGDRADIVSYLLNTYGNDYTKNTVADVFEAACYNQDLDTFSLLKAVIPLPDLDTQVACAFSALSGLKANTEIAKKIIFEMPRVITSKKDNKHDALLAKIITYCATIDDDTPSKSVDLIERQMKLLLNIYPGEIIDRSVRQFLYLNSFQLDISYQTLSTVLGRDDAKTIFKQINNADRKALFQNPISSPGNSLAHSTPWKLLCRQN